MTHSQDPAQLRLYESLREIATLLANGYRRECVHHEKDLDVSALNEPSCEPFDSPPKHSPSTLQTSL